MRKYQIFISSSYRDLVEERKALTWAIMKLGHIPVGMEAFTASNDRGWNIIQGTIDNSDYFILIIAARYGSIEKSWGMSWTEREYEYAIEQGVPVMAFVKEPTAIVKDQTDSGDQAEDGSENQRRQQEFIEKVASRHLLIKWRTQDDLIAEMNTALGKKIREDEDPESGKIRPGWYRGSKTYLDGITNITRLDDAWHTIRDSDLIRSYLTDCREGDTWYWVCINPQAFMQWRQHLENALRAGISFRLAYIDIAHVENGGKAAEMYAASLCMYGTESVVMSTRANLTELSTTVAKAQAFRSAEPDIKVFRSHFPHPFIGALCEPAEPGQSRGWGLTSPYLICMEVKHAHNFGILFREGGTVYQRYLSSMQKYFEFLGEHGERMEVSTLLQGQG
jgi:Domain of unknown function (DUF4062)